MKKFFFSLVAAIVAATATYAQSSLVATLSHDGETTQFYGANALVESHEAAADGDVITLSSGAFTSTNITKGITLRGAGMKYDSENQKEPTVLQGSFYINIPESVSDKLTIEGVFHNGTITNYNTLKGAVFSKSRFNEIKNETYYNNGKGYFDNVDIVNCWIVGELNSGSSRLTAIGSYIKTPNRSTENTFINCVLANATGSDYAYSTYKNCILTNINGSFPYLPSSAVAYNCIAINNNEVFKNIANTTNSVKTYADIFKTYTGTYSEDENFELTNEAASTYLGMDGTQVGIYGGTMPFDPTPSNPQVTKFEVDSSTANGKLTVKINVE